MSAQRSRNKQKTYQQELEKEKEILEAKLNALSCQNHNLVNELDQIKCSLEEFQLAGHGPHCFM